MPEVEASGACVDATADVTVAAAVAAAVVVVVVVEGGYHDGKICDAS